MILDSKGSRRKPVERSHRQVVGTAVMRRKLNRKILQGEEGVAGIEALLILPVAALHLAVVPGCVRPDQLVPNAQIHGGPLKEGEGFFLRAGEAIGELKAIIRLDTFHFDPFTGKPFIQPLEKIRRGIGGLFGIGPQEPQPGELVDGGVLI